MLSQFRARRPSETNWQERAACRGPKAAAFFPPLRPEPKAQRLERERLAKRICMGCDVRSACLEYALEIREPHGIWGGLTESERQAHLDGLG